MREDDDRKYSDKDVPKVTRTMDTGMPGILFRQTRCIASIAAD
jgi:hypothetical protein